MPSLDIVVKEFANVGLTILVVVGVVVLVRWLDRNVFNKSRYK